MLGRLEMNVPDCLAAYKNLASDVFNRSPIVKAGSMTTSGWMYDADSLQKALQLIIKENDKDGNMDALMSNEDSKCKV
jgi:hypothetical protein